MSRNERKENAKKRGSELLAEFISNYERGGMAAAEDHRDYLLEESPQESQMTRKVFDKFAEAAANDTTKK